MSDIDSRQIQHIARLARIAFSEEERAAMTQELASIVSWIDKLAQLDTTHSEPSSHLMVDRACFRPDAVKGSSEASLWLRGAPASAQDSFEVPRVVD